jgi:hypothetical protein
LSKRDADSGVGKHERRLLQYRRLAYMERAQMPHPFGNPHYHHCLQTLVNPVLTTHLCTLECKGKYEVITREIHSHPMREEGRKKTTVTNLMQ